MELEFRNGRRWVPDHVASILLGIDTYKMTYEEAMKMANDSMLSNHLDRIKDKMVRDHFRDMR